MRDDRVQFINDGNKPCSACGDGDTEQKFHIHVPSDSSRDEVEEAREWLIDRYHWHDDNWRLPVESGNHYPTLYEVLTAYAAHIRQRERDEALSMASALSVDFDNFTKTIKALGLKWIQGSPNTGDWTNERAESAEQQLAALQRELEKFQQWPNVDALRECMVATADENAALRKELAECQRSVSNGVDAARAWWYKHQHEHPPQLTPNMTLLADFAAHIRTRERERAAKIAESKQVGEYNNDMTCRCIAAAIREG